MLGEWDIFTVGFRFLWEKRTTFRREFLEFGRQRSAGMSRGAWCLLPVATRGAATSHINNLALVDHSGQINSRIGLFFKKKEYPAVVCRVTRVHVHVVCLCVNTPVSVTCFLSFAVETETIFLSTKFNVLEVSVTQKEQSISEIP